MTNPRFTITVEFDGNQFIAIAHSTVSKGSSVLKAIAGLDDIGALTRSGWEIEAAWNRKSKEDNDDREMG